MLELFIPISPVDPIAQKPHRQARYYTCQSHEQNFNIGQIFNVDHRKYQLVIVRKQN